MFHSIKNPCPPPLRSDLGSNNLLLTIQYLFLSERTPLESFNFMYLAAGLLLSFCCDAPFRVLLITQHLRRSLPRAKRRVAHLYCRITIQLKNDHALKVKSFLVCFGLPSSNKELFTYSLASLAMTKTLWTRGILRISGVFVIARPLVKNIIILSSDRPKQSIITQQISANR